MKKAYNEPTVEFREYSYCENSVLTYSQPENNSGNSLTDDDTYDNIFGK